MLQATSEVSSHGNGPHRYPLSPFIRFLLVFLSCTLLVWLLYFPVSDHYFVSDDFKVLRRVCLNRQILIRGFFRPLSDITLFLNYQIDGFDPKIFNGFNLLVHAATATLLFYFSDGFYRHSLPNNVIPRGAFPFALISTILFLAYPFHSEAVVWLLGRGASMAAFFCLAALCCCQNGRGCLALIMACVFYFIALLAYESAFVLPLLILLLMRQENRSRKERRYWLIAMTVTLVIHILVRLALSGSLLGSYGAGFSDLHPASFSLNVLRTLTRLFLPPMDSMKGYIVSALALMVIALYLFFRMRKKQLTGSGFPWVRAQLLMSMMLTAAIVPFVTSVSVHTTESDRMLYLPSIFVCLLAAALIERVSSGNHIRLALLIGLTAGEIFALGRTNSHWREAGQITKGLLAKAVPAGSPDHAVFLHVPDNLKGAFVFRQGFVDALVLRGRDTVNNLAGFAFPAPEIKISARQLLGPGETFIWEQRSAQWVHPDSTRVNFR